MVNAVSDKYSREQLIDRAFYRIAWNINHMWSETGSSDTRLLLEPLIPESFVVVGASKKGSERREHVVPRVMLCEEAHNMFGHGSSVEDVAQFLKKYLKIVLISKEEQENIDHTLGLKQSMPDGWSFADGDPFSRLHAGNVDFEVYA